MQTITTIGFDIAKSVFQVHGVDAAGRLPHLLGAKRTSRKTPKMSAYDAVDGSSTGT